MFNVTTSNFGEWLLDAGLFEPELDQGGEGWSLWTTQSLTDGANTKRRYLYVTPSCSWSELEKAKEAIDGAKSSGPYGVVFPTSAAPHLDPRYTQRLQNLFPIGNKITLQALYHSALFNRNLRNPSASPVENFVEQRVSFPSIPGPTPALTTIVKWLRGEINTTQRIAVLLAPGGQGKTTLSRQIFNHFATAQYEATVPLLVNSAVWGRSLDLIADMDDIWRQGIRECYPDAGVSPEMLQRSLFLGAICPIFDGLDELCTVLPWDFKPDESVSTLISAFEGTFGAGRLLITSRLTFWEDNISPSLLSKVFQITLHKFDEVERSDYLRKRFPNDNDSIAVQKRKRAARILTRISTRTNAYRGTEENIDRSFEPYDGIEFVPFVVMLAADSADTEKSDFAAAYGDLLESSDPLRGLLLAICEREELRHKMPMELTAEKQLKLIELLAGEFGSKIADEDVQLVFSELDTDPELRIKLIDHNLIRRRGKKFEFTYDFIFDYLRAGILLKWLQGSAEYSTARNVLVACAEQPGNLLDGIADLVRSVCGDSWVALAHARWLSLRTGRSPGQFDKAQAGFFLVILALVKRDAHRATRTERLLFVFGDFNSRQFSDLYLEGSLDNLDLRNVKFQHVFFGDIEFAHCEFDEKTVFENCRFQKRLFVENCKDFGRVACEGGSLTAQVRSTFQRFKVDGVDKRILADQIEEAMFYVLRKFHRGVGIKTCKEEGIRGSLKNEYGFGDEVVDELVKTGVLERFRHVTLSMLRVKAKGDVFQFFNNNYRRGTIRTAYERLVEDLAGKKQ